jgi:hypothetical protein
MTLHSGGTPMKMRMLQHLCTDAHQSMEVLA